MNINLLTLFLPVFDNLSKFAMLIAVHEFSRIYVEKYRSYWGYFLGIGLALAASLLGYNGYSEYPRDAEYATIIFFTILIPAWAGIYRGLKLKPETLDQMIYTRRFFPEYRLLSDQAIIGIFRELYPKIAELTDKEIITALEVKYSSAPVNQTDGDQFTLLPNTRRQNPEFRHIADKYVIQIFKNKFPELKDSLDIGVVTHLEKKFAVAE